VIRDIQRALEGKNFETVEEVNAYLASLSGPGAAETLHDTALRSAKEEAQELAFDAMEAESDEDVRELAERALAKDPDCVDAMLALTSLDANSAEEALDGLRKAVEAGERSLGTKFFKENKGHFWMLIETRPYMRARQGLADLLGEMGSFQDAIPHYAAMLELNPNDNQGVRYPLLGTYLAARDLESARKLLAEYEGDSMATFAWGRVLERFLSDDIEAASAALKTARKENPFVERLFSGEKEQPLELPESYTLGSNEEAIICMDNMGAAWVKNPDALMWLVKQLVGEKFARRTGKKRK
jgi:tetratricopeptide (TPR) repeat protein